MIHILKSNSTISNIDDSCIQPNAVDLRLLSVKRLLNTGFLLSEEERTHCDQINEEVDDQGYFRFLKNDSYQIEFDHYVEIAENESGYIKQRSTLNRNGVFILSGLYDSGFKNNVGATLYCLNDCKIKINTRVAQFILNKSESVKQYDGIYNEGV